MIFYLLSLLPILVWAIQWYFNRQIIWKEAAVGTIAALAVATIFHLVQSSDAFVPSDTETWSGRVHYAQFQPRWLEYYEYAVYRTEVDTWTDGDGQVHIDTKVVFDHWEPTEEWHPDRWWVVTELGNYDISESRYDDILQEFGDFKWVDGVRQTGSHNSRMLEGVRYDDQTVNKTGYVYPVTARKRFDNRLLKAKGSLYSFEPVPAERAQMLPEWPDNEDMFTSERLIGTAKDLWSQRSWDQMNAVLGPTKNVNLIAIGFPAESSLETGMLQEQYWRGGKKNDLVLTYGGDPHKPSWAYVFGWTERELVKRLLENRLREGTATIEEITKLVEAEYELVPFEEKFSHIRVETPTWYYVVFFIVVAVSQGFAHAFFSTNYESKDRVAAY